MPIYDYRCTACGELVEVVHAIDSPGPTACARCGGVMRKALSPPAIHFKGSGWAKVDARSAATKPKAADGKDTPSSDDAGGGADVKPSPAGTSGDGAKASGTKESGTKATAASASTSTTASTSSSESSSR